MSQPKRPGRQPTQLASRLPMEAAPDATQAPDMTAGANPALTPPTPARKGPIRCAACLWGQDISLGPDLRRCRRNPPTAHYQNRQVGHASGVIALGMFPTVADQDYCSRAEPLPT